MLVAPIIDVLQAAIVDRTLDDAELPVRLVAHDPSWTAVLLIGLGLLALAEVFREGSNLRELEKATI